MPLMCTSCVPRSAEMECRPGRGVRAEVRDEMQEGQWRGTAKVVWFERGGGRGELVVVLELGG